MGYLTPRRIARQTINHPVLTGGGPPGLVNNQGLLVGGRTCRM